MTVKCRIGYGDIFQCAKCKAVKWLPTNIKRAQDMQNEMYRLGNEKGYIKFLKGYYDACIILAHLQGEVDVREA